MQDLSFAHKPWYDEHTVPRQHRRFRDFPLIAAFLFGSAQSYFNPAQFISFPQQSKQTTPRDQTKAPHQRHVGPCHAALLFAGDQPLHHLPRGHHAAGLTGLPQGRGRGKQLELGLGLWHKLMTWGVLHDAGFVWLGRSGRDRLSASSSASVRSQVKGRWQVLRYPRFARQALAEWARHPRCARLLACLNS